jgi:acyl carrier protein
MMVAAEAVQQWIVNRVSELTGIPPNEVDVEAPIERAGLDSIQMLVMTADLENWLGFRFRGDPRDEFPTIAALARFVAAQGGERTSGS